MFSSSSKTIATTLNDRFIKGKDFDGHRGVKNEGGWWISLEEAKQLGMGECWYKETMKSVSNIPYSAKSINAANELLWLYESGNMYLGSWKSVRCGSGGRFLSVEHGDGISYEATPTYRKGHCFSGKFENGVASGYGRSFWLHNSPSWISNSLPESQIKEDDDVTGRRTGDFLPYEYVGQWRQNQKHDRYGVVTLKDGTKKIGGWAYDINVSDKWWVGFDHSPASIPKERVDWWTVHEDYVNGYLKVSSPASRSKKRKKNIKQHESSSCYFSSIAAFPAATSSSVAAVVSPTRASHDVHGQLLRINNRTKSSKSDRRQRSTNNSNNRYDTSSKEIPEETQQNQETDNASDDVNAGAVGSDDPILPNPAHISSSSTTQAHHQSSTTGTATRVENTSATGVTTHAVANNSNRNMNSDNNSNINASDDVNAGIVPDPAHISSSSTTQHHISSTTRSGVENTNAIGATSRTVTNGINNNSNNRGNNNNDGGSNNNVRDKDHDIVFVLKWEAIGYNANDDEMENYAKELNLLGLHSIKMIVKYCKDVDVNEWTWMKKFHKRAFKQWLEKKRRKNEA